MGIRIQLASNFQVVELTYNDWDDVKGGDIKQAIDLVNTLGKDVINDIKTTQKSKPTEEMATKKQVDLLVGKYGCLRQDMVKLTKKEAWKLINKLKAKESVYPETFPDTFEAWEDEYYNEVLTND